MPALPPVADMLSVGINVTQVFNRRVVAHHLGAEKPVSLVMAIPDHPWD